MAVPLNAVEPHAEGVFTLSVTVLVAGPAVAFLPEGSELGEAVVPAGFVLGLPGVVQPPGHRGKPATRSGAYP